MHIYIHIYIYIYTYIYVCVCVYNAPRERILAGGLFFWYRRGGLEAGQYYFHANIESNCLITFEWPHLLLGNLGLLGLSRRLALLLGHLLLCRAHRGVWCASEKGRGCVKDWCVASRITRTKWYVKLKNGSSSRPGGGRGEEGRYCR